MTTTPPEPSTEERLVLRTIWDIASATSCWPVYLEVARRLARQGTLDLANVLQCLNGRRLVGFNKPLRDSSIIGLSVAGAAACPVPDEVLSAFLAIVKAAGERSPDRVPSAPSHMSTKTLYDMSLKTFYDGEDRVPPVSVTDRPVSVTDRDFTDDAGLRRSGCSRLLQLVLLLLRSEDLGLESFSGPNADGHWSASFDPLRLLFSARDRRGQVVENLDDYVSKRQEHSMLFRLTKDEERKASLIANLGLLADELIEWIYDGAAGSVTNVVSCEQFRPDIDPWIIDEVLHRLTSENRISLAAADSMQALPHVLLTEDSAAQVEKSRAAAAQVEKSRAAQVEKSRAAQVEKSRAAQVEKSRREKNRVWRDHAGRNALLAFVHEKKAESRDVIHLPQDFLRSPRSAVAGDYFSEADVLAASHYLQDKGLVRGDEFQITHLTDRGYDCIEQGGNVAKYSHRSEGSGTDIRISNPQGVIINSPKSVQNNFSAGIDMRDLLKFAGFVRQIESTLGLAEGEQTELEAQAMELHEVASSPAPEEARLRRLANRILRILGTAAPTVASQMAIELGDKALRALGA